MDEEKKELTQEKEDCNPLTDEEFKEYLKEEQRKEKKVKRILKIEFPRYSRPKRVSVSHFLTSCLNL